MVAAVRERYSPAMAAQRRTVFERVLAECAGEPRVIAVARCLAAFLREKEIVLRPDDVLAGHGQYCDYTHSGRGSTDTEIEHVLASGAPWSGEGWAGAASREELAAFATGLRLGLYQRGPGGHVVAGYDRVLALGLGALTAAAREREDTGAGDFAIAARIGLEAAGDYIARHAELAAELAEQATSAAQRAALERIAAACAWVATNPPRSLFEAVQLLWLTHEIVTLEEYSGSLSLGRLDQYLYPYYARDRAAGLLTAAEAQTWIEALWLKFAGLRKAYQHVVLGGWSHAGGYVANELSVLCLRASAKLKMDQPLLSVRWHETMPDWFWAEVQALIEVGSGFPALFNDEVAIAAKRSAGVSAEDAEHYAVIGCVELTVPGREFAHTEGLRINWAKVLELLLHGGVCPVTGRTLALSRPRDLAEFRSFDDFRAAYAAELAHFTDLGIRATNTLDRGYGEQWPTPFVSSTMAGCLESGRDVTMGGTVYNLSSINGCGMANVADALAAVQRAVFAQNEVSLSELAAALRCDFAGEEASRAQLALRSPKFGNDDEAPDGLLRDLVDGFCAQVGGYGNPRGGRWQAGLYTVEAHAFMGKLTGALPDGRKAGAALANALSPAQGADQVGPTAVIRSVTKLDHTRLGNGMVLDLKFHPALFADEHFRRSFRHLAETYFRLGGLEIQFNVVSRETLLAAQAAPDQHRDLVVRVSGFSAYFVELDKTLQDEIIARTEYRSL